MCTQRSIALIFLLINCLSTSITEPKLQLKNFKTLNYNDFSFETINPIQFNRKKRDTGANTIEDLVFSKTRLKFHAFDRYFNIYLKRDLTLVTDKIDIEVRYSYKNKPNVIEHADTYFTANNYIGYVEGEPKSSVVCYFEKADSNNTSFNRPLIYAQIRLESNKKREYFYIEPSFLDKGDFEYLIYRNEDIASNVISNGVFNSSVCKPLYAEQENNDSSFELNRPKRDAKLITEKKTDKKKIKNRCNIALVADYKFYQNIGNSNIRQTTAYLLNIIGAINGIYTNTVWRFGDNVPEAEKSNYGFSVDKIIVLVTPEETESEHYNTINSSKDSLKILQLFSRDDYASYCLAHLFTYKSFDDNVLGLAYVSSPLTYELGGICSRPSSRERHSFNIGLSSYKSVSLHQGRLLQREAELVTAHEFGHNWGAPHDPPDSSCSPDPGRDGGNYLMYQYSNQGHDRNNDDFSSCSIISISEVLKTKATCFVAELESYCGNGHIENDEECDAGIETQKDTNMCCNKFCKLRPNTKCSDANHNCCQNCQIAKKGYKCWSSPNFLDCFEDHSYCDGTNKDCPVQEPLPAGSDCTSFDYGKCDSTGHCLSICQQKGSAYAPCLCTEKENKCRICCRYSSGNITRECEPFQGKQSKFGPYYLSKGRPCSNGICNENAVCEQKVKDYVTRLWKVIKTVTVSGFVEFMKRNIVASIILISLSLWVPFSCCIHFCIDKRNRAIQNQRIQILQKEIIQKRNSGFQNNPARTSNMDVRERLLIRTEHPENKLSPEFL